MKEFQASIIEPGKRQIKCRQCHISYSGIEYKILFEAKKIIYFNYDYANEKIKLCNCCLLQYITAECLKLGEAKAKIIVGKDKCFQFAPFEKNLISEEVLKLSRKHKKKP